MKRRCYPNNWNTSIDDVGRHLLAQPRHPLMKIHDVYAACVAVLVCWHHDGLKFLDQNARLKLGLLAVVVECSGEKNDEEAAEILGHLIEFVTSVDFDESEEIRAVDGEEGTGTPPSPPH